VFSLWAAHQGALNIASVDTSLAQTALVFREGVDVNTLELPAGAGQFVKALQINNSLIEAVATANAADKAFDLANTLALLIHYQLITHITTEENHYENTD
jgi:hypothetical protein